MPSIQQQIEEILNVANIPALSMGWHQGGKLNTVAGGVTDTTNPTPVDRTTLFQAASLSKPVSAAIVLDLLKRNGWRLNTPLIEIGDYAPPDIRRSPYYRKLTIGMVKDKKSLSICCMKTVRFVDH